MEIFYLYAILSYVAMGISTIGVIKTLSQRNKEISLKARLFVVGFFLIAPASFVLVLLLWTHGTINE